MECTEEAERGKCLHFWRQGWERQSWKRGQWKKKTYLNMVALSCCSIAFCCVVMVSWLKQEVCSTHEGFSHCIRQGSSISCPLIIRIITSGYPLVNSEDQTPLTYQEVSQALRAARKIPLHLNYSTALQYSIVCRYYLCICKEDFHWCTTDPWWVEPSCLIDIH